MIPVLNVPGEQGVQVVLAIAVLMVPDVQLVHTVTAMPVLN